MSRIKLVTVTWSYDDTYEINDSFLIKSFLKNNDESDLIKIHFNRNNYKDLETEFNSKFGYQYEFLLYRIYLLKEKLSEIVDDLLIFSDTGDVVCLDNIQKLDSINFDNLLFSSENHRYPNEVNIMNWSPNYRYPQENYDMLNYLNAGLSFGKRENFITFLNECVNTIFPNEYKNFGGDQGVFTYYYINNNINTNSIRLDNTFQIFLSTYLKSYHDFKLEDGKIVSLAYNTTPMFIHDNGWNYGSPKFINHFNLLQ